MSETARIVGDLILDRTAESFARAEEILSGLPPMEAAKVIIELLCHIDTVVDLCEMTAFGVHLGMFTE